VHEYISNTEKISGYNCNNENVFGYDIMDKKDEIKIPIYFLKNSDNDSKSEYPRIIFGKKDMTLDDLRKKIYFNLRKYIFSPLIPINEQNTKDTLTQEIQKYIHNMKMDEDKLFELIDEEYTILFNKKDEDNDDNTKKNIEQFLSDIPFKLYLIEKNTNQKLPIIDENNFYDLSEELSDLLEINSFDSESLFLIVKNVALIIGVVKL
jgi:hypothetical protein